MSISLVKGQKIDLTKGNAGLRKVVFALGWDLNRYDGDDEVINIKLDQIPTDYETIAVTVTIYDAENRLQNFGMVENAYVRVVDADTGEELMRFDLSEDFSTETALVVAEIYRHNGEWKFKAVGSGYSGGLKSLCNQYGIDAE